MAEFAFIMQQVVGSIIHGEPTVLFLIPDIAPPPQNPPKPKNIIKNWNVWIRHWQLV